MVNPWEEGLGEEEPHTPYLWRGAGEPTPESGAGFRGHEAGLSAPPWDPPQVQVGSGGPEELGEAQTAGRGGLAGRGWPQKGRSLQQVPACRLKVSSGQVLCNRSRTHQPLLLRPVSMLNCSLWLPACTTEVSEPISAGRMNRGARDATPTLRSVGGSDPGEAAMRVQGWEEGGQPRGGAQASELVFTEHRHTPRYVPPRAEHSSVQMDRPASNRRTCCLVRGAQDKGVYEVPYASKDLCLGMQSSWGWEVRRGSPGEVTCKPSWGGLTSLPASALGSAVWSPHPHPRRPQSPAVHEQLVPPSSPGAPPALLFASPPQPS